MKKTFLYLGLAMAALAACSKAETPVSEPEIPDSGQTSGEVVLTATIENTRVSMSTESTTLSWVEGDEISVYTSKNRFVTFSNSGSGALNKFKATLDEGETVTGYAVYPANDEHSYDGTTLTIKLPDTFAWVDGQTRMPMVAAVSGSSLDFTHAGGVLAFKVSGIPANATSFLLVAGGSTGITGSFEYNGGKISTASGSTEDKVNITFTAGSATERTFYVPVPTGTYADFTISTLAGSDEIAKTVKQATSSSNVIDARSVRVFTIAFPGTDIYAAPTAAGTKTGSDASNPATLDKALAMAEDGDEIHLAAGTYSGAFSVTKNVTLQGADKTTTILDGGGTDLPINVSAAGDAGNKVYIKDLTVQNGSGGAGGGIFIGTESFAEVSDCIIKDNTASLGGGGLDNGGTTVVSNTTFSANTCTHASNGGGAIWNMETTGNLTLNNCTFTDNTATFNGGVAYNKGVLTSNDCTYTANVATGNNGGVFYNASKSELFVNGGVLSGNSAKTGGVIYNDGTAKATFDGISATDNSAQTYGGVFRYWTNSDGGYVRVYNSHIYGNHITNTSGTIGGPAAEVSGNYGNILFVNCTIDGNDSKRHVGSIYVRQNAAGCKAIIVNSTITANTHGLSSYSVHAGGANSYIAVYNSVVAANTNTSANSSQEVSTSATIKNSVTNNAQTTSIALYLFAADGTKGTTDYAPVSNILGSLSTDVYPLAAGEGNPARTGGMSTAELTTLAGTLGIDSAILLKDQKGNSREGKTMMGAYVGD